MTIFKGTATINCVINDVYSFLTDMNNHQQLMPEGVTNWSSTTNNASFNVQGMIKLAVKIEARVENSEIRIISFDNPPFDLELKWALSSINDQTVADLTITADLNMMMKIMASGPLQKLADHEVQTLKSLLS